MGVGIRKSPALYQIVDIWQYFVVDHLEFQFVPLSKTFYVVGHSAVMAGF